MDNQKNKKTNWLKNLGFTKILCLFALGFSFAGLLGVDFAIYPAFGFGLAALGTVLVDLAKYRKEQKSELKNQKVLKETNIEMQVENYASSQKNKTLETEYNEPYYYENNSENVNEYNDIGMER